MGNPLALEDAISYFQMAGILLAGLVIVSVVFRREVALVGKIPLIGAVFVFALILVVLFVGMGFFFLTEYWGWSEGAQRNLKYAYFGIVFLAALALTIWAHTPRN
jgi:hypothetical protein